MRNIEPEKYSNSIRSERPDIQSNMPNIGVEVVTCDFSHINEWTTLIRTDFLTFLNRVKAEKKKRKDIEYIFKENFTQDDIDDFLSQELYIEVDGQAVKILDIEQLRNLKSKEIVYFAEAIEWVYKVDEAGLIVHVAPPAQWISNLPNMLLDKFKLKHEKFKTYKKFDEKNLFIQSFSVEMEEINDFEESLRKYVQNIENIIDNVYITCYWGKSFVLHKIQLIEVQGSN